MIERTVSEFGRLDMAFNNAGILGYTGDPADESADSFDQVTAINLRGVWTCMKHELAYMRTQGTGAIVNCSSLGGLVGRPARHLPRRQARRHRPHQERSARLRPTGIRINAVCPGVIETPMNAMAEPARPRSAGRTRRRDRRSHPLAVQRRRQLRARRRPTRRRRLRRSLTWGQTRPTAIKADRTGPVASAPPTSSQEARHARPTLARPTDDR